jgi:hypothetical protein
LLDSLGKKLGTAFPEAIQLSSSLFLKNSGYSKEKLTRQFLQLIASTGFGASHFGQVIFFTKFVLPKELTAHQFHA